MTMQECEKGKEYKIISLATSDEMLNDRFLSFGISRGKSFLLSNQSLGKSSLSISINGICVALRDSEARQIIVEEIC